MQSPCQRAPEEDVFDHLLSTSASTHPEGPHHQYPSDHRNSCLAPLQGRFRIKVLRNHFLPLFAFLSSGFQKNGEQDIREVLSGITEVADETGCAFVLVRHFNKKEDLSAVYGGGGSIGITA